MDSDRAGRAETPADDTAASRRDAALAAGLSAAPRPGANHPSYHSEPGTDAEMIERRLRTANPLLTPSPGPGASSTLRREVLYAIRTGGPAAPDEIADRVGASRTGVLQQLRTLETAGLVTRSLSRHGVGRPRHVYDLTPAAQELFPANYGSLTQSIMVAIRHVGGEELVERIFEARRELLAARIKHRLEERLPGTATLWERVREVASYTDDTGYLGRATREADGTIRLEEHNCAIYGVSGTYKIACAAELQLFAQVLNADVTRECCIATGGRSCTYRVEPKPNAQPEAGTEPEPAAG